MEAGDARAGVVLEAAFFMLKKVGKKEKKKKKKKKRVGVGGEKKYRGKKRKKWREKNKRTKEQEERGEREVRREGDRCLFAQLRDGKKLSHSLSNLGALLYLFWESY